MLMKICNTDIHNKIQNYEFQLIVEIIKANDTVTKPFVALKFTIK